MRRYESLWIHIFSMEFTRELELELSVVSLFRCFG